MELIEGRSMGDNLRGNEESDISDVHPSSEEKSDKEGFMLETSSSSLPLWLSHTMACKSIHPLPIMPHLDEFCGNNFSK